MIEISARDIIQKLREDFVANLITLGQRFPTWGPWTLSGPRKAPGGPQDFKICVIVNRKLILRGPQKVRKL